MKICMITASFLPNIGGGEIHVYNLTKKLASLGYNVEVHVKGEPGEIDVPVVGHKAFWRCKCLVLHLHGLAMSRRDSLWNLRTLLASGYVFTPHNSVIALKERRLGFISIPIAKRAKRVLAVSEWEKREMEKMGITKITVVPNGVSDLAYTLPRSEGPEDYLLYLARISRGKNQLAAVRALRGTDVKLYMVGPVNDQGYLVEILREAKRLGVEDRVKYLGVVSEEEKFRLIDGSLAVILVSDTLEAEGIAVKEAMVRGKPVIVRNRGALPYLVKDGINGFVVNGEEEITNAVSRLRHSPELREEMGELNRKEAEAWKWDAIAKRVLEVYREVYGSVL